jgi:hypothetical protein
MGSAGDLGLCSGQSSDAVNMASPTHRPEPPSVNSKAFREDQPVKNSFTRTPDTEVEPFFACV